eukprot:437796-Rhodomonas_salina.5
MPAHLTTRISESSDCWMLGVHAHGDPSLIDTDRQRQHKVLPPPCRDTKQLQKVFKQYCAPNQQNCQMDSAYFTKLAKDCQLLDSKVTSTDVDLIFVKVKDMQEKRITYDQFLVGLAILAERKGVQSKEIEDAVSKSEVSSAICLRQCWHVCLILTKRLVLPGSDTERD